MSQTDKQWLFLQAVAKLINKAKTRKTFKLTGGELQRTPQRQQELVNRGKSWTLNSYHLSKKAIDFNIFVDVAEKGAKKPDWTFANFDDAQWLGDFWESLDPHHIWGGYFPGKRQDIWHFERRNKERKVRLSK